jgi:NADH:ubiquinone reductase (H+-translocating)
MGISRTRQAVTLASNVIATMGGQSPQPFKFKILGLFAAIGRRAGVAEILGMKFFAWLWRGITSANCRF